MKPPHPPHFRVLPLIRPLSREFDAAPSALFNHHYLTDGGHRLVIAGRDHHEPDLSLPQGQVFADPPDSVKSLLQMTYIWYSARYCL